MRKIRFLTELKLVVLMDNKFRLTSPFLVSIDSKETIKVPEGFETDLASVPRLPIVYLAVGNTGHKAAVLHDWLYATNYFNRAKCDLLFYHALRESGIGYLNAQAMYLGVRVGGGKAYDFYTKKLESSIDK
jgi:hypothetical protein